MLYQQSPKLIGVYLFVVDLKATKTFYDILGLQIEHVSDVFGRALWGDEVVLEVKDDGRGFDPGMVREQALQSHHFGILGMQEKAELVGGSIELISNPETGTEIHIQVPCSTNGDGL